MSAGWRCSHPLNVLLKMLSRCPQNGEHFVQVELVDFFSSVFNSVSHFQMSCTWLCQPTPTGGFASGRKSWTEALDWAEKEGEEGQEQQKIMWSNDLFCCILISVSHADGLVQERRNSSALATELRLSCIIHRYHVSYLSRFCMLTHWSLVIAYCVRNLVNIGSGNGLLHVRHQAFTWINSDLL